MNSLGSKARSSRSHLDDWKNHLFIVLVSNISVRIPKGALAKLSTHMGLSWMYFSDFSQTSRPPYAFVRYKYEDECLKATRFGDKRKMDGRFIRVRKAMFGWKDRRSSHSLITAERGRPKQRQHGEGSSRGAHHANNIPTTNLRDNGSYKDVLFGLKAPMTRD
ncbi:hypothetical protein PTKIN_Ptkin10aG0059600 [Pterospermum kingtungense]